MSNSNSNSNSNNNNNNNNSNNSNSNRRKNIINSNINNKYINLTNIEYNKIIQKMSKVENSYHIRKTGKVNIIKKSNNSYNKNKLEKIAYLEEINKSRGFSVNNNINSIRQRLSEKNRVNISKISRMVNVVYRYLDVLEPGIKQIFKTEFEKLIRTNIIIKSNKSRKFEYKKVKYNLIPSIYNSSIPGNFKVNNKSLFAEGTYAKVYKNINLINKNKERKLTYVFKIIEDKSTNNREFKSLIFNICLLAFLYFQNNFGIKYFCDLYEFGEIKKFNDLNKNGKIVNKPNSFYAIMENGGKELFDYEVTRTDTFITNLSNILIIIKECSKAIQILHKIGIIHCDIKLENFLFTEQNGKYDIKIIDFGFCIANGTAVSTIFGSHIYIPWDFYFCFYTKKPYTITIRNDIYALGIMFIELLYNLFSKLSINTVSEELLKKIENGDTSNLKDTINTIIEKNIFYIFDFLKIKVGIKFSNIFLKILKKITYLVGSYTNLSEFINDIDKLLKKLLKLLKLLK